MKDIYEKNDIYRDVEAAMAKAKPSIANVRRVSVVWGGVSYVVIDGPINQFSGVYRWERDGEATDPGKIAASHNWERVGYSVAPVTPTPELEAQWLAETRAKLATIPWFNNTL
jgi:hypothetical protein